MIIIPSGIDCGLATLLKKYSLRRFSLPFDWSVSYGGISKIIKNKFQDFIPKDNDKINHIYNYNFYHNDFPQDTETIVRRCNRLLELLETTTDHLVFIRKGHAFHHHRETEKHKLHVENDITDAQTLSMILKEQYPNLKYKIMVILVCDTCFDSNTDYTSTDVNLEIHNIATPTFDDDKFEKIFKNLLLTP